MYINTFKYTPKDVSCQLCTEYVKKLGCTALRCPWLAERIEAGVVGYREAVLETFPHERRLFQRLNLLIKHYPGSLWSNEQHERRMQYQCAVQGYSIDDDLGSDSTCDICVKRENGDEVCKAQIRFHNGDGYENEEGLMEAADSSEYDTVELDDLKDELFAAIESLNPYPEQLSTLVLENKGAVQFVDDCPCEQCGKCGVSINPDFLPSR